MDILINSFGNLKHLSLQNSMLDRKQVKDLMIKLVEGTNLTSLDLSGNDLSFASASMLASVVLRVERAGLRGVYLNIEQIQEIFERVDESCALKHLSVADNDDLGRVSNDLKLKVGKLLASVDFKYETEKEEVVEPVLPLEPVLVSAVKRDPLACNRCKFKGKTEKGLKMHMARKYCITKGCTCPHNVHRNKGRGL